MNNYRNFKKAFSKINVSEELENSILNSTVNKKTESGKKFRLVHVCSLILILFALTFTTVYAKEIKEFIIHWSSSIFLENGSKVEISKNNTFKKISKNIEKTEENGPMKTITISEFEKMLGFSILKSDQSTSSEVSYMTGLNKDGSIGRMDVIISDFIVYSEEKNISLHASFLNEDADEGYILAFKEGLDATGGKDIDNTYSIKNLNINVVIYTNDWDSKRLSATFVYDNILYKLTGKNITENEMLEIIENIKL
ncbi:MAG: hypothetical protein PHO63_04850 [Bacilli bacterium]|nr:hypothetical protein [Bacilli bacterium]MDD4808796.1 hypothetical protein [Bacilli bacterium]